MSPCASSPNAFVILCCARRCPSSFNLRLQLLGAGAREVQSLLLLITLAAMNDREAGYPIGGSLPLAQELAQRYLALGGEITYRARVVKVLVENDQAVGVRLENGRELRGDLVISAADGRSTIFDLLEGRYLNDTIRAYYRDLVPSKSILQVSLGVARDFSTEPPALSFPLPQPIYLGNVRHERLVAKHYCFDPTMAPPGKSVLTVWCEADYDYWQSMRVHRAHYRAAKELVAQQVIAALERRYPGLATQVEVVDVATPVTYERYTDNWRGAFAGWALTTRKMSMMMGRAMSKTLPGLSGFYMIGQWVEPTSSFRRLWSRCHQGHLPGHGPSLPRSGGLNAAVDASLADGCRMGRP